MPEALRVAIVGAGPAGIYAADILKRTAEQEVSIDLFEQLPAPYGLVRYGVAPDHPRIKGIIGALREVLESGVVRLFGNVRFGEDIVLGDLERHYHAVILATGATKDAPLEIPGIDLDGSYGAADFVSWYDGHPDVPRSWPLEAKEIAVLGVGNVALDVARVLAKHPEDLMPTEVPANAVARSATVCRANHGASSLAMVTWCAYRSPRLEKSAASSRSRRRDTAGPLRVLATLMLRRVEVTWMSRDTFR